MHTTARQTETIEKRNGFALIATISVMVLLVMVALAMLSLSSVELRSNKQSTHQAVAQANARLALMQAINELQIHTGPDQRVTARAAILESGSTDMVNRNWLGVWSTTVESSDQDWPVIGKAPTVGNNTTPYTQPGAYVDLRHSQADLSGNAWKTKLRRTWLVSKRDTAIDITQVLDENDDNVIELIGQGMLGKNLTAADFQRERVLVQKVDVDDSSAYAWYVADNNQKASIDPITEVTNIEAALEASPRGNPAAIKLADASKPYDKFTEDALGHEGKLITYGTASLTQTNQDAAKAAMRQKFNHFTTYSPGLFVDTMLGGLRKDLTPLLLAKKSDKKVNFTETSGATARNFSSGYPIIPGADHGVLGPSFGAMRNWALHTYSGSIFNAETTAPASAIRMRPTTHWPHNISDGAALDAKEWPESAPKIHPIMTDSRWHYYFSHHNKRIRTHIVPRVCLWNPYNRELITPALTVMMPNPFYGLSHGMHFFPEEDHVENDLRPPHSADSNHVFTKWIKKSGYVNGDVYKMRTNPFPETRYLAFTLESTSMAPGECHVFSPKVTNPGAQSNGVRIQQYQPTAVSSNVLSSSSAQGTDHFYYDHADSVDYEIQNYTSIDADTGEKKGSSWKILSNAHLNEIDFGRFFDYQPEVVMSSSYNFPRDQVESFPFILKSGTASSLLDLHTSNSYPTLQLINNAAGGAKPATYFSYIGKNWGPAGQAPGNFGNLQTFSEAPLKDAPATHQVGAKLLWFDESATEGNNSPLRVDRWTADHMAYNVSPVANWNVRAQLTTRSPASQCALQWYMTSTGPWLLQFAPLSPQDFNDQPSLNASGNAFVKNPFGAAVNFSISQNVVLFDLPSPDYGVLSMAKLRHAMLSPYSWNPSYIIGHSLRNMHAPADSSAHSVAVTNYNGGNVPTRWDFLIGGDKDSGVGHGPYAKVIDSQGLLQIGNEAVTRSVGGTSLSSSNEILAYDIAYEVNQNLWDSFFISGMPLSSGTQTFSWDPSNDKPLWNRRYQLNYDAGINLTDSIAELSSGDAANTAFWKNAQLLKNRAAFNVNSTSVDAWTAFLSGTLGIKRPLVTGELDGSEVSFARYREPMDAADTADADPDQTGAWQGGRKLTETELRTLASNIVIEVKKRGPFVSLADFVNRRLTDQGDETSKMGALDAAIKASELNIEFERDPKYQSTAVNVGTNTDSPDNNLSDFKDSYRYSDGGSFTTVQPASQAWGMPGFLTQSDVLEPIAPALSVRGDTYTIRAYGESREGDVIKARAWLEVTVERSPQYVDHSENGNEAGDAPLLIEQNSGTYLKGNLNDANQRFGRRFIIKSYRWLSPDEI